MLLDSSQSVSLVAPKADPPGPPLKRAEEALNAPWWLQASARERHFRSVTVRSSSVVAKPCNRLDPGRQLARLEMKSKLRLQ